MLPLSTSDDLFSTTLSATLVDVFQLHDPSFSVMFVVFASAIKFMASLLQVIVSLRARAGCVILLYLASPCINPVMLE